MITAYAREGKEIISRTLTADDPLPPNTRWIDMLLPSEEERAAMSTITGQDLPTPADMEEIEASSRLYLENDACFMTAPVVADVEGENPKVGPLTFVLTPDYLITLRHVEPKLVPQFSARLLRQPELIATAEDAAVGLIETMVDRSADVIEVFGARVERISRHIFGARDLAQNHVRNTDELAATLKDIGQTGEMVSRVRYSLSGFDRVVLFLRSAMEEKLTPAHENRLKVLTRDLQSLIYQADSLSQRIYFLLDATLGVVNIQQNNIVRIFSVAAVALMPPTLIASIYGMNFRHLPELDMHWGYPLALAFMACSAIVPVLYFRKKGWL